MKNLFLFIIISSVFVFCNSTKNILPIVKNQNPSKNDTIRIANKELEYEIIIIDNGFNFWLAANARPRNFYSQSYLEARNYIWVQEWNNRVLQPMRYNTNLYEMSINYESSVNYGYEVNYLLFNYLTYFQIVNNQRLGGFSARI